MCETGLSKLRLSQMPLSHLEGVLPRQQRFACAKHCTSAVLQLVNILNTQTGPTDYVQLFAVNFWRSSLRLRALSLASYKHSSKSWCAPLIILQNTKIEL